MDSALPTNVNEGNANSAAGPSHRAAGEAIRTALDHLETTQSDDGSWHGDYGGPMFLLPMYVVLCHIAEQTIPEHRRSGMVREFLAAQRRDGGIGLHREGASCLFTSVLGYVSLRLLGEPADREELRGLRLWIAAQSGPTGSAPWGKWILCLLGLYDYRGLNPIPPELWLLPRWLPVHPGRLWCHCRMVYLPASWLYGARATIEADDVIEALRSELYEDWAGTDFTRFRNRLAPSDNHFPPSLLVRTVNGILHRAEPFIPKSLRQRALAETALQIDFEDEVTSGFAIGPVNRVLNTLCHHFREPGGIRFAEGMKALESYLWEEDGRCSMQGYNNSCLWDTAFAVQAAAVAGALETHPGMMRRAHVFIRDNRILEDVPDGDRHYREASRGGWPFSDRPHGWPITDCTAEGFRSALLLSDWDSSQSLDDDELLEAIPLLLSWQNTDGGWPTYERKRGSDWLEQLNPSGVFARIMVDYSYPECTAAVLETLNVVRKRFPAYEPEQVARAMKRGETYLRREQRDDGSWEGSWGVCFTYGTWFGVGGLHATGTRPDDPALQRAAAFLLSHQHDDGGWGERIESCLERQWIDRPDGHVVQTSWALLSLLLAGDPDPEASDRAAAFLLARQQADGNWPHEGMVGVFNRSCAINYDWYRLYFPLRALAAWRSSRPAT